MRALVKRAAEVALGRGPIAALGRRRHRGRALVLAWHNVVPDDLPPVGDRSLHLPLSRFRAQLDVIQACCDVVPVASLNGPGWHRPRVALTFDDAYAGAVRLALPELLRRELPATVFVTPGRLDGHVFWWDTLAGPDGLDESLRALALDALAGTEIGVLAAARGMGHEPGPVPDLLRTAAASELTCAANAAAGRLTFGGHTDTHPALPRLDTGTLTHELRAPLLWLRANHPETMVPWMAYPYGLASSHVAATAAAVGWEGAFLVRGGYTRPADLPGFMVPRYNVPAGLSPDGLAARLAGWLGG